MPSFPFQYVRGQVATPDQVYPAGSGVGIACSAAGIVNLRMKEGGTYAIQASAGHAQLDGLAVTGVLSAGTTATAVVTILI